MSPARVERRPATSAVGGPVDDDGVFFGYASLFGVTDLVGDLMMPGAFQASLQRRGVDGIKLLHQHEPAAPVGRWLDLKEDDRGLKVRGQLHAGTSRGREVLSLMRAGILDGLSIGFRTVRARSEPKTGIRRVAEVDLWEISIVTFPMLPGARVGQVAAPVDDLEAAMAARLRTAAARIRPA